MRLKTSPKLVIRHTLPTAGALKPEFARARGTRCRSRCLLRAPAHAPGPSRLERALPASSLEGRTQLNLKVQYVAGFFCLYP